MEGTAKNVVETETTSQETPQSNLQMTSGNDNKANNDKTVILFPESPVYEPEDETQQIETDIKEDIPISTADIKSPVTDDQLTMQKRKLTGENIESIAKIQKLDLIESEFTVTSQTLDDEVSEITSAVKRKIDELVTPSTSRVRTPVRSSPRKITKRSNSTEVSTPKTSKTPKSRSASVDITKERKTPRKVQKKPLRENLEIKQVHLINSDSSNSRPSVEFISEISAHSSSSSRPSVEFVSEIPAPTKIPDTIPEEYSSDLNDSQNMHLELSPTPTDVINVKTKVTNYNSDPVLVKDREEVFDAGKVKQSLSEGCNYSDQSNNIAQVTSNDYNKKPTIDQDSTDSVSSIILESPEPVANVTSKLISKLSKVNLSTPTKISTEKNIINQVLVKDREALDVGKVKQTQSEMHYSDQNSDFSEPRSNEYKGKSTDQESTASVSSILLDSPDSHAPSITSKLISKLSNGNSSTPTEIAAEKKHKINDSDSTPDMVKLDLNKGKRGKNDLFRSSNTTTPSTISPLQNGHSLPINTPQIPVFDIHVSHNEDGEFLSLYVVRTDNDIGMDMCKEFQRFSKRFTIDPYLGDVSVSTSPSSVTSVGMINLPNRTSFASTVSSSSTSSNRTSDGAFVVPQPPRKSVSNPSTSVKGFDALLKKLHDVFAHEREVSVDEGNGSASDEKVSVGIQASPFSEMTLSNGNASPEEVIKCDKATPKSSLKKTRVRGRRHLTGKTKRAILPTQNEEPEYLQGMNSPEMVPMNGENEKTSPVKSPKDEKPLSSLVSTPKSLTKLKQKRRPTSPRPATPVEKAIVKPEYPGYSPDTVVLARWVDKRYYSGKVLEITEPNKYLIKFDDGQIKALLDDFIIFGDMKTLPLQGQSVYAMVDEEQNFEPGLVLGVEENDSGTVTYRCTTDGDTVVMVTASELYLTEDQARSLKESARPRSPATPRRRHNRELDLDNIIQGPRSARNRDKGSSSARKRVTSPKSPKASTSGVKTKSTPVGRKRLASESSEMSESSNSAPPARLEEVAGVEPEVQRTPRKIDGVKAGPLQLKGAAKQNIGKKNSKLTKFENDEDTVSTLGPIPSSDSKLFVGFHFLLTCTEMPRRKKTEKFQENRHYSSEEDGESTSTMVGTDSEDLVFSDRPFNKERLKEQLEAGGGIVHSHFDDVPRNKYSVCKMIAPRPCLTAKYIQCLAADIRAISHAWVIMSCIEKQAQDLDSYALPAGWSILKQIFINWVPSSGRRNTLFFKDKLILICSDQDSFVRFWERVCTLAGASTRVVNEEELNMTGAHALVTEWDCPHVVQNKANQDNVPLVSTTWVVQCLIETRVLAHASHDKFSFMYTEPE